MEEQPTQLWHSIANAGPQAESIFMGGYKKDVARLEFVEFEERFLRFRHDGEYQHLAHVAFEWFQWTIQDHPGEAQTDQAVRVPWRTGSSWITRKTNSKSFNTSLWTLEEYTIQYI